MLESTEIKTAAFRRLFDGSEAAVRHHLDHLGISRYEKFRHITTEILGRPYTPDVQERLGRRFSELVLDEVLRCPFVPGARELLERLQGEMPLFVASGTPEDELREIVSTRGLKRLFSGVYGSPASKADILRRVVSDRRLRPEQIVMVGDADTDLNGARDAGVRFVGRVASENENPFAGADVPVVRDLSELDRRWDELFR